MAEGTKLEIVSPDLPVELHMDEATRRMLDKKQDILGDRAADAVTRNLPLQLQGLGVFHDPEVGDPDPEHLAPKESAAQEIAEKLQPFVGRKLRLKILEVNRKANRLILSEKVALYEERREKRDELFSSLQVSQKVTGTVRWRECVAYMAGEGVEEALERVVGRDTEGQEALGGAGAVDPRGVTEPVEVALLVVAGVEAQRERLVQEGPQEREAEPDAQDCQHPTCGTVCCGGGVSCDDL